MSYHSTLTLCERILEAIHRQGKDGMETCQIQTLLGRTKGHTGSLLCRLKKEGKIYSPRRGLYVATEDTRSGKE